MSAEPYKLEWLKVSSDALIQQLGLDEDVVMLVEKVRMAEHASDTDDVLLFNACVGVAMERLTKRLQQRPD